MSINIERFTRRGAIGSALAACAALGPGLAGAKVDLSGGDPLGSTAWPGVRKEMLGTNARVEFDARVKVTGPRFAEDALNVPISVDATELTAAGLRVQRMLAFVDRNPIRKVLEFAPGEALPRLTFRFKLEQASPVRVAVLTQDGVWRVGAAQVDAAGGGCTVSGASRADGSWSRTLNQVQARFFPDWQGGAGSRLRVRIMHPMDTGLVAGIPAFHLERLQLADAAGKTVLSMRLFEPVSENPTFSFDLPARPTRLMRLDGADNNGNRVAAEVPP